MKRKDFLKSMLGIPFVFKAAENGERPYGSATTHHNANMNAIGERSPSEAWESKGINRIITPAEITKEALAILKDNLVMNI